MYNMKDKLLISIAIEDYLAYITYNDNKAINTLKSYKLDLFAYKNYFKSKNIIYFEDITYNDIMLYLNNCLKYKKNNSIARSASAIREFHKYIVYKYDLIDVTNNISISQSIRTLPIYCSISEINLIMDSFDDHEKVQLLDHSILELIYGCGLRVSEATGLTISEVNFETQFLNIIGKLLSILCGIRVFQQMRNLKFLIRYGQLLIKNMLALII